MVYQLFFMFSDASVELVYQAVNRRVHVVFGGVCVNRTTIYIDGGFCFVSELFDGENAANIRNNIEMALYLFDFCFDVASQGIGYFDVMTRNT